VADQITGARRLVRRTAKDIARRLALGGGLDAAGPARRRAGVRPKRTPTHKRRGLTGVVADEWGRALRGAAAETAALPAGTEPRARRRAEADSVRRALRDA